MNAGGTISLAVNMERWHQRIESRPTVVDGWTPTDWGEVMRVQCYYQEWKREALAIGKWSGNRPLYSRYNLIYQS